MLINYIYSKTLPIFLIKFFLILKIKNIDKMPILRDKNRI